MMRIALIEGVATLLKGNERAPKYAVQAFVPDNVRTVFSAFAPDGDQILTHRTDRLGAWIGDRPGIVASCHLIEGRFGIVRYPSVAIH